MPADTTTETYGEGKRLAYYMDRLIAREMVGCAPSCCCCFFTDIRAQITDLRDLRGK